ncbi:MAG: hypothetical protein JOZ39_12875 [Chloroflexi bacterium]|nr:hypothetical protein [Chloroflexota bacterium]
MKFGTPIDDFNTRWFVVDFYPLDEGGHPTAESLRAANNTTNGLSRATMEPGWPAQVGGWWDHGNPLRQGVMWEDEIICATQGTSDRNNLPNWEEWHLGSSDRGVVFQRKQWREQVERVRKGLDPIGIVRDPAEAEKMIHVTADFKRMSWEDAARMFDMSVDERLAQIERGEVPGVPTRSF